MRFFCMAVSVGLLVAGCTAGPTTDVDIDEGEQAGEAVGEGEQAGEAVESQLTPERAFAFSQLLPTEFSREDLINTAQSEMYPYFEESIVTDCDRDLHVFFEESDPAEEDVKILGESILKVFCDDLSSDIWLVVGEYEFLRTVVSQNELRSDGFGGVCGTEEPPSIGCALYDTAWVQLEDMREEWISGIAAHELFHVVQDSISPDPPSWSLPPTDPINAPVWVFEGSANFFQASLKDYLGIEKYQAPEEQLCELQPGRKGGIDLKSLEDSWSGKTYSVGQFATEYLVANYGFDEFLSLWRHRDEGFEFSEAFSLSFDISLEEFYELMSQISLLAAGDQAPEKSASDCESGVQQDEVEEGRTGAGVKNDGTNTGWCGLYRETHTGEWWNNCPEIPFQLGAEENSDHGYSTTFSDIPIIGGCNEIESIGFDIKGWAATFLARETVGASDAFVSTAHYAKNYLLDTNGDGVICSAQAPED